jgi:hypothetical protein
VFSIRPVAPDEIDRVSEATPFLKILYVLVPVVELAEKYALTFLIVPE